MNYYNKNFYRKKSTASTSKYKNKKITTSQGTFDSKKEYARFCNLQLLEKAGRIKDLKTQVKFEIVPKQKDERAVSYVADFVYYDNELQSWVIEDTKSAITKKNSTYIIKRKLVKYQYKEYIFKES